MAVRLANDKKTKSNPRKNESKVCASCEKSKKMYEFYKVESILYPDGMVNVCSECIKDQLDEDELNDVIDLLRQMNKPFVESVWMLAVKNANKKGDHPLGEYMQKINSMKQYRDMTYRDNEDPDDAVDMDHIESVKTEYGKVIEYDKNLSVKWGLKYTPTEILQLEKSYQEMVVQYEAITGIQKAQISEVCVLTLKMKKAMEIDDYDGYQKLVNSQEKIMKGAGLRPIDMKTKDEEIGLKSFSEVFARVEEEGFVPQFVDFPKDDIDDMMLLFQQSAQRFNEQHVSEDLEDINWRDTAQVIRETIGDYRDITRPKEKAEFVMSSMKKMSNMKPSSTDGVEDDADRNQ